MVDDVVGRPHPLVRGHGHHELAGRFELGGDRGERGLIVGDMLDHVERADQVVVAVGDAGELGQRRAHHCSAETLLRDGARFLVELETFDMTEAAEHGEVVTGAAADLENLGVGGRSHFSADQVGEHPTSGAIPPMTLVQLSHLLIDDALHQRNTSCRLSANVASGVKKIAGINGHQVGPCTSGPVSSQINPSLSTNPAP